MRKRLLILFALVTLMAMPALAQDSEVEEMNLERIVEMSKAGLSNETLINAIIASNATIILTVKDILYLKQEGVNEDVINFLLRTRPIAESEEIESVEATGTSDQPASDALPAYVQDAADGNYYDGYEYTDGYDQYNDRDNYLSYHYYGSWLRWNPFYFGFYYYPVSYYYYSYWPDDYYYYFYYPRLYGWSYYYQYPYYYGGYGYGGYGYGGYGYGSNRYYYSGGRYIKSPGGKYTRRYGSSSTRYAVPRNSSGASSVRSRGSSNSTVSSIRYRSGTARPKVSRPTTYRSSSPRRAVPRSSGRSSSITSKPSSRSRYSKPSSRSSSSRSRASSSGRSRVSKPSSGSSRSRSSSSGSSRSAQSRSRKK